MGVDQERGVVPSGRVGVDHRAERLFSIGVPAITEQQVTAPELGLDPELRIRMLIHQRCQCGKVFFAHAAQIVGAGQLVKNLIVTASLRILNQQLFIGFNGPGHLILCGFNHLVFRTLEFQVRQPVAHGNLLGGVFQQGQQGTVTVHHLTQRYLTGAAPGIRCWLDGFLDGLKSGQSPRLGLSVIPTAEYIRH